MRSNDLKRARTGHLDCCGEMIRRKDRVTTKEGTGRVAWACGKWWIVYPGRRAVALNEYPAESLRRERDNGTKAIVPRGTDESIVPGQRKCCPADCPAFVPHVTLSESVGYVSNGTMGQ